MAVDTTETYQEDKVTIWYRIQDFQDLWPLRLIHALNFNLFQLSIFFTFWRQKYRNYKSIHEKIGYLKDHIKHIGNKGNIGGLSRVHHKLSGHVRQGTHPLFENTNMIPLTVAITEIYNNPTLSSLKELNHVNKFLQFYGHLPIRTLPVYGCHFNTVAAEI